MPKIIRKIDYIIMIFIMALSLAACGAKVEQKDKSDSDMKVAQNDAKKSNTVLDKLNKHFYEKDGYVYVYRPIQSDVYQNGTYKESIYYTYNEEGWSETANQSNYSLKNTTYNNKLYEFDSNNNISMVYDEDSFSWKIEYTDTGRPSKRTYMYDSSNTIISGTKIETVYTYDEQDRLIGIQSNKENSPIESNDGGTSIEYAFDDKPSKIDTYDLNGNVLHTVLFEYNNRGFVTNISSDAFDYSYEYDDFDNVTKIIINKAASEKNNGKTIEIEYELFKIKEEDFPYYYYSEVCSEPFYYDGLSDEDELSMLMFNAGIYNLCTNQIYGLTYLNPLNMNRAMVNCGCIYKGCSFNDLGITTEDIQAKFTKAPLDKIPEPRNVDVESELVKNKYFTYNHSGLEVLEFYENGGGQISNYSVEDWSAVVEESGVIREQDFRYEYDDSSRILTIIWDPGYSAANTYLHYQSSIKGFIHETEQDLRGSFEALDLFPFCISNGYTLEDYYEKFRKFYYKWDRELSGSYEIVTPIPTAPPTATSTPIPTSTATPTPIPTNTPIPIPETNSIDKDRVIELYMNALKDKVDLSIQIAGDASEAEVWCSLIDMNDDGIAEMLIEYGAWYEMSKAKAIYTIIDDNLVCVSDTAGGHSGDGYDIVTGEYVEIWAHEGMGSLIWYKMDKNGNMDKTKSVSWDPFESDLLPDDYMEQNNVKYLSSAEIDVLDIDNFHFDEDRLFP